MKESSESIENPSLNPILEFNKDEVLSAVKTLRGKNNVQHNCAYLVSDKLEYFKTGKKPTVPSCTEPSGSEIFDVLLGKDKIKREATHRIYTAPTSSAIDRGNTLFSGIPFDMEYPQTPNGSIELEMEKDIINVDSYTQLSVKYYELNNVLKAKASEQKNKVSLGLVNLGRCGKYVDYSGHMLLYFATPNQVWYVDGHKYDGETDEDHGCIFDDISNAYKFNEKIDIDTFGEIVFYTPISVAPIVDENNFVEIKKEGDGDKKTQVTNIEQEQIIHENLTQISNKRERDLFVQQTQNTVGKKPRLDQSINTTNTSNIQQTSLHVVPTQNKQSYPVYQQINSNQPDTGSYYGSHNYPQLQQNHQQNLQNPQPTLSAQNYLNSSNGDNSRFFQSQQYTINELLDWTVKGHLEKVEEILIKNPALVNDAGTVTALSDNRDNRFEGFNFTGYQISKFEHDEDMQAVYKKYLTKEQLEDQDDFLRKNFALHSQRGLYYNITPLKEKMQNYLTNSDKWSYEQCCQYWQKEIGSEYRKFPAWLVYAMCEEGNDVAWTTNDRRRWNVERQYDKKHLDWWFSLQIDGGLLGAGWAPIRGPAGSRRCMASSFHIWGYLLPGRPIDHDHKVIQSVEARCLEALNGLKANLDNNSSMGMKQGQ